MKDRYEVDTLPTLIDTTMFEAGARAHPLYYHTDEGLQDFSFSESGSPARTARLVVFNSTTCSSAFRRTPLRTERSSLYQTFSSALAVAASTAVALASTYGSSGFEQVARQLAAIQRNSEAFAHGCSITTSESELSAGLLTLNRYLAPNTLLHNQPWHVPGAAAEPEARRDITEVRMRFEFAPAKPPRTLRDDE
jgi:hypothetical protein